MRRRWLGAWLAAGVGVWWCARYTAPMLNPFSLDAVLRDDWAQHCLGWLYFRHAGPSLPLGKLPDFLHPVGTTIGYMDAIPWVALLLRPFSAWLPVDFQYLGAWILLCSATLAFVTARMASAVTPHWEQQALVGTLTVMSPILIGRIGHPALCAHAFVVAALWLGIARSGGALAVRRRMLCAFGLVLTASATHPYFAVMSLSILAGLPWTSRRQLGVLAACGLTLGLFAAAALVLTLLGYLGGGMQDRIGGFGQYSANLNTLFNSMGNSRLLPGLPHAPDQYEGYGYLGAGTICASGLALLMLVRRTTRRRVLTLPWSRARWPLTAVIGCGVFAVASPVRLGTQAVFTVGVYQYLAPITESFRSSGRFIWPLAYSIVIAATLSIVRALRPQRLVASAVLACLVALQAYDLRLDDALGRFARPRTGQLTAAQWSLADGEYKHLVLYPAQVQGECGAGNHERSASFVNELAYLAYRHHWSYNSGYAARYPPAQRSYCDQLNRDVARAQLQANTLYIVSGHDARRLRHQASAVCGKVDHLTVCALPHGGAFSQYLAAKRH